MFSSKRFISCLLISAFSIAVSGCESKQSGGDQPEEIVIPSTSEDLRVLDGVNFDYSNAFFDDFSKGVDYKCTSM